MREPAIVRAGACNRTCGSLQPYDLRRQIVELIGGGRPKGGTERVVGRFEVLLGLHGCSL